MFALQTPPASASATTPELLDCSSIDPHPDNPRQEFPAEELNALAASLTDLTLLAPIQVQPTEGGRYQLLSGERRWRAAKLAGWERIPAYVRRGLAPHQAVMILAEDNLLHRDLNPIEQARALHLLVKPMHDGGVGMQQQQVAERYRKDPTWVTNLLRLLRLPACWQEEIRCGGIFFRQARALVAYVDRPDVLAAVAADRAANPADWLTAMDFEKNLAAVAQRLDNLAGVKAPPRPAAAAARKSAKAGEQTAEPVAEPPAGDGDETAPASLTIRRLPAPNVNYLLNCVERMNKPEELQQLQEAVALRLLQLRGKRKPAAANTAS